MSTTLLTGRVVKGAREALGRSSADARFLPASAHIVIAGAGVSAPSTCIAITLSSFVFTFAFAFPLSFAFATAVALYSRGGTARLRSLAGLLLQPERRALSDPCVLVAAVGSRAPLVGVVEV